MRPDRTWMNDAACIGYDPEMWFPVGRRETYEVRRAVVICKSCPVNLLCDHYRREIRASTGIWGGRWLKDKPDGSMTAPQEENPRGRPRKQPEVTITLHSVSGSPSQQ